VVSQSVTKYHMGKGGGGWQKCHVTIFFSNFTSKGL
jgi:hypothetical protein